MREDSKEGCRDTTNSQKSFAGLLQVSRNEKRQQTSNVKAEVPTYEDKEE